MSSVPRIKNLPQNSVFLPFLTSSRRAFRPVAKSFADERHPPAFKGIRCTILLLLRRVKQSLDSRFQLGMAFQFVLEGLLYLRPCVLRIRRGKEIVYQRGSDSPEGYPIAFTLVSLAFTSIGSLRFVEEFGVLFAKSDESRSASWAACSLKESGP